MSFSEGLLRGGFSKEKVSNLLLQYWRSHSSICIVCLDPHSHFQNDISPSLSALFEDPDSGFLQFLFPQGDNLPREGPLG